MARKIGDRIRDLRKSQGLAQHELGARIGVPQATIHKWEKDKQMPSDENAEKLANFFGKSVPDLLGYSEVPSGLRRVDLVGDVAAGEWTDSDSTAEPDEMISALLPAAWDGVPVHAFRVSGPSVNKVYPDGSYIYVVPLEHVPGGLQDGQMVVAVRQNADGLYERTVKKYVVDSDNKAWLWPQSDHPEHQTPLPMKKNGLGPEGVRVIGVVIMHMALTPAAALRG